MRIIAFFTTAASMIAFINSVAAGAGVALLAGNLLVRDQTVFALLLGVAAALVLMAAFLVYQRWRYRISSPVEARGLGPETERSAK